MTKNVNNRAKSKKCQQIISSGEKLFMRHGIKRISVKEICDTAGVSKMTFYKYFDNKVDLALYIIKEMLKQGEMRYLDIMAMDVPYQNKAREIIKMKIELSKDMGREIIFDFLNSSYHEITEFMKKKTQENMQLFLKDFIKAQKQGDIRSDIKPEFILYFLNNMRAMIEDEKLTGLYASTQALTAEIVNFFFYGILSREEKSRE